MAFNSSVIYNYITSHHSTIFLFVSFFLAGVVTYVTAIFAEERRVSISGLFTHFFPHETWSHSTRVDLVIYFISKLTQRWIAALSMALTVLGAALGARYLGHVIPFNKTLEATKAEWVILGISFVLFIDFGQYASHWLQHRIPALWEFHKVHHSATVLTPLTTFRFHPVGNAIDGVFLGLCLAAPVTVAELLYGMPLIDLLAISATANVVANVLVLDPLHHTQFQISFGVLDRLLMSPGMHQVHHSANPSHWGRNYGARFSIWDWCFGTGIGVPRERMSYGMGVADDESGDFASVWWCYVGPFVNCSRLAKRLYASRRKRAERAGTAEALPESESTPDRLAVS